MERLYDERRRLLLLLLPLRWGHRPARDLEGLGMREGTALGLAAILRLALRLGSVVGVLLLWHRLRLLIWLLRLRVRIARLRLRAGKGVMPALLRLSYEPLLLVLVLVVAMP